MQMIISVILEHKEEILKKQREEKEKLKMFREKVSTVMCKGTLL